MLLFSNFIGHEKMVDLKKAKEYLRIDYTEDDEFIRSLIAASKIYLENACGEYTPSELTDLAQLILIEHWNDNRTLVGEVSDAIKHSVDAIIFQLRYCSPLEKNESRETKQEN